MHTIENPNYLRLKALQNICREAHFTIHGRDIEERLCASSKKVVRFVVEETGDSELGAASE
jgi:hypothetical protein